MTVAVEIPRIFAPWPCFLPVQQSVPPTFNGGSFTAFERDGASRRLRGFHVGSEVGIVRKFRELLPPTSKEMIAPAAPPLGIPRIFAHPVVGEVLWEIQCLLGMPRLPSRSKRRPRGNREQVRLHGHRFVPDASERNSENLCPLALFREIPSCSVSLRRCAAVHKIAPPSGAPLVPMPGIPSRDWRHERMAAHRLMPTHHGRLRPRREDCFGANRTTDLQRPSVSG
jgi:hypothetical protein